MPEMLRLVMESRMTIQRKLLIAISVFWIVPTSALGDDCGEEGSSAWAGCVAYNDFQKADEALNSTYRKLISAMNTPKRQSFKDKLIAAEKAWVSFRDKDCDFVQDLSGGFNKAPGLECKTDMTNERTQYLERLLDGFQK